MGFSSNQSSIPSANDADHTDADEYDCLKLILIAINQQID